MKQIDADAFAKLVEQINSNVTRDALNMLVRKINQLVLVVEEHSERIQELEGDSDEITEEEELDQDEDAPGK